MAQLFSERLEIRYIYQAGDRVGGDIPIFESVENPAAGIVLKVDNPTHTLVICHANAFWQLGIQFWSLLRKLLLHRWEIPLHL